MEKRYIANESYDVKMLYLFAPLCYIRIQKGQGLFSPIWSSNLTTWEKMNSLHGILNHISTEKVCFHLMSVWIDL